MRVILGALVAIIMIASTISPCSSHSIDQANACHIPHPVYIAATAGSDAFVEPVRRLSRLIKHSNIGISLTNGSLMDAGGKNLAVLLAAWRGHPAAIGSFYSQALTPHVPKVDYATGTDSIGATAMLEQALAAGFHPTLVALDITTTKLKHDPGIPLSDAQLSDAKLAIQDIKAKTGARIVTPWLTPNDGIYGNFAKDVRFSNQRAAALFGGGIAIDVPTGLWFVSPPAYRNTIVSSIRWTRAHRLAVILAVSPFAAGALSIPEWNYDNKLLSQTQMLVAELALADALPTRWMVQNYGAEVTTDNRPAPESDPNSLANVAVWLSNYGC